MKVIEPSFEILTPISEGGIKELQMIERIGRICYKSEDKITPEDTCRKETDHGSFSRTYCLFKIKGIIMSKSNVYLII